MIKMLLQINKILDDTVRLLDDVPWYMYLFVVVVIVLLTLIKPFVDYKIKQNNVKNIKNGQVDIFNIDSKIFVKVNQEYLAKNEIETVLNNVNKFAELTANSEIQKQIIHLSSRFYEEKKASNMGLKEFSDTITMNKIRLSLLELLENILRSND